jgi:hypothetical protein
LRAGRLIVTLIGAGVLSVGCGSTAPPTATPPPNASSAAASVASLPAPLPTPANGSASAPAGSLSTGKVAADPSLLDRIPAAKAGVTLTYDPDTTASVAAAPSLATDASAIATGLAVPSAEAASPTDFVIVNVVRLRSPKGDDEWFRQWRDTYDQAACEQAGGVAGNAEADLGTHHVFIGTCAGGAITYHTLLDNGSTVLSLTAVGPGRLGETLIRAVP